MKVRGAGWGGAGKGGGDGSGGYIQHIINAEEINKEKNLPKSADLHRLF